MLHNSGYSNGHNGSHPSGNGYRPPVDELADDEISLRELVDVLLKGKWIILSAFSAVLLLVAGYTFLQAPKYESSATLFVSNQGSSPQLGQLLGLETGSRNISNEIEILKSRASHSRLPSAFSNFATCPVLPIR
jgi:uncharacterized protein involved in exopolysaccharide biosynthesis